MANELRESGIAGSIGTVADALDRETVGCHVAARRLFRSDPPVWVSWLLICRPHGDVADRRAGRIGSYRIEAQWSLEPSSRPAARPPSRHRIEEDGLPRMNRDCPRGRVVLGVGIHEHVHAAAALSDIGAVLKIRLLPADAV